MLIHDILDIKVCGAGESRIHGIPPEGAIADAIRIMRLHGIGSVVIQREGRLCGLLTLREILAALDTRGAAALDMAVSEVMNHHPTTACPDDTIDHVRRVMTERHISHLPVMDGDRLLDIISLQDVAKAAHSQCSFENRLLKHYISYWPEQPEAVDA